MACPVGTPNGVVKSRHLPPHPFEVPTGRAPPIELLLKTSAKSYRPRRLKCIPTSVAIVVLDVEGCRRCGVFRKKLATAVRPRDLAHFRSTGQHQNLWPGFLGNCRWVPGKTATSSWSTPVAVASSRWEMLRDNGSTLARRASEGSGYSQRRTLASASAWCQAADSTRSQASRPVGCGRGNPVLCRTPNQSSTGNEQECPSFSRLI